MCEAVGMLTWRTAGESHGPAILAFLDGIPSGLEVDTDIIGAALAERRLGYGRGARQKFERDKLRILSGVRHGLTTGAPITIEIGNSEWPKWETVMSADPVPPEQLLVDAGKGDRREMARNRALTTPRPGHADLAGMVSYRLSDSRDVLERASARETAARVAAGAVAKQLLKAVSGTEVISHVVSVGLENNDAGPLPAPQDRSALQAAPMRTLNQEAQDRFVAAVDAAKKSGETIGGTAQVIAWNVPLGLGSHVSGDQKLDANLAAAMMSIQSVKAVEIGDGFALSARLGSTAHDEITLDADGTVARTSNFAGGIEGGTSNGEPILVRIGFKPISTVPKALQTVDLVTGEQTTAFHQRSDTAQVVPGAVIGEAMMALTLAAALLERFGGRSVQEVREQYLANQEYAAARLTVEGNNE